MDLDALGPGPDIDAIDETTLSFGNELPSEKAPETPEPTQAELEAEVKEANGEKAEGEEPKGEAEKDEAAAEQGRDEKGRFTEARIPKSRFDEAVGKEREAREAAERRAAELEARLNSQASRQQAEQARSEQVAAIDTKVGELETKYQELLLDGNTKEAAAVMREIRLAERQIAQMEAEEKSAMVVSQALEQQRFDATVARLEADYPMLNPESEVYDDDLVQMVVLIQRDMVRQGAAPSQAMAVAAQRVMARVQPQAPAAEPESKGLGAAKQSDRTQKAVETALAAQKAQPPSMKEVGYDSDSRGEKGLPDVTKMTADEFDALPEATKARLMGNLV